jgi:prophage antirepressor-like protein
MIYEIVEACLGFPLHQIEHKVDEEGNIWYKVKSFRELLGLSNTTYSGTNKVPAEHKRRIETLTLRVDDREMTTRPVYVSEVGLWIIVMLNTNERIRNIRQMLAVSVFPHISQLF